MPRLSRSSRVSLWPLLALAVWLPAAGKAPPDKPRYTAAIQEAETAAYELLRHGDAATVGIAIATRDRLVWTRTYGVVDRRTGQPASAETRFGVGSVSKVIAAVAVMQLVDEGRLALDAPLVRYLPSFRMADPRYVDVTVGMLLDHSAGFPGSTLLGGLCLGPNPDYARRVMAELGRARLKDAPGHMAVYCNDCFTMVEPLVEAVTGMRYADYVRTRILAPLGMTHSTFPTAPLADGTFARTYRAGEPQAQEFSNFHASGGLLTTPSDLATFGRMFLGGGAVGRTRILSGASVEAMAKDRTAGRFNPVPSGDMAFGLGWDTARDSALAAVGIEGWAKSGATGQYQAELLVAPREGLVVAVMGPRVADFNPLAIADRVMLRALAESGRIAAFPPPLVGVLPPEAPVPDGLLAAVAGVYARSAGAALLVPGGDGSLALHALGERGFEVQTAGLRYRADGWFTSAAQPFLSVKVVEAGGRSYLAQRSTSGVRTLLDPIASGQRVVPGAPLSAAWRSRVGREWLVVNERHDSMLLWWGMTPRLRLEEIHELPGFILVRGALAGQTQLVDPSADSRRGAMFLVIPGDFGRDTSDLEIVVDPATTGGEEWVRWGGYLHRPRETVVVLPVASTTTVAIGGSGHAEWRAVESRTTPVVIGISGATAWRLYGPDLASVASGKESGKATLPTGSGPGYLVVWGNPGGSVTVNIE